MAEAKEKKYVSDNAQLMAEWDWEKNEKENLDPRHLTIGMAKNVWWKCEIGHEWKAIIKNRANGRGCPYCSGMKILKGYNDLQTINPVLASEWNYEKNDGLTPADVTPGSSKKIWWKCESGHEWSATISHRNNGTGCPYCSRRCAIKGENDLQTVNPNLALEWNYEKNDDLTPANLMPNSRKKVWWKCSKGHEWKATINSRNNGCNCPYCSGKKIIEGYNDLQAINPVLASEWNYEKNGELTPVDVTPGSSKKIWWKCTSGHEWSATIGSRNAGYGCPFCSGRYAIKGKNDLQTVNPNLASEWNFEKNGELTPADVSSNSDKKVWWECYKGHTWNATIGSRNSGRGCPICASEQQTSFPEYAILYYLKKICADVIHSYKQKGYEIDIYIPSKKIGIEYDGYFWHKDKTSKDLKKNNKCKKDGIQLYRLREGLPSLKSSSIDFVVRKDQKNLSKILTELIFNIADTAVDVDISRDTISIERLREYSEKENSFFSTNPQIAEEWNYNKNGSLKPQYFSPRSNKKVWWLCKNGHEWQATIHHRTNERGCPYCSNTKVLEGYNDLQTVNPVLAKEWNHQRNTELSPIDVTPNSGKIVLWMCGKGHEWKSRVADRNKGGGCPFCSSRKVFKGFNDLQTINPTLAKEWDYEANIPTPSEVMPNSNKKAWWKCSKNHEWEASINSRNNGCGCPYCSNNKVAKGFNDLQTINPILAKEWNYEKNDELRPENVLPNSGKKVWWRCSKGHEWQASIDNRNKGRGCPFCSSRKVFKGFNDLQTINPTLAKEWDYEANIPTPSEVMPNSNKKAWWKCSQGHKWQAIILNRNRGQGCPECARTKRKKISNLQ